MGSLSVKVLETEARDLSIKTPSNMAIVSSRFRMGA
jgi:hypothetical protein